MTTYEATLIPGDGIGPEVSEAARRAIDATGVRIRWDVQTAGAAVVDEEGTPLPDRVIESIRRTRICFKGPVTTPVGTGFRSVNVALRKALDLYAAVRPVKSYPGTPSRYGHVDMVVIRENTEDVYAGIEFDYKAENTEKLIAFIEHELGMDLREDVGVSIKLISRFGTERVVRFAFEYARKNNRRKVTAVHKANIMKASDGLFLAVAREVAAGYPDIQFNDLIVDNAAAQLVLRPETFDVLVLPNLYGDIISDLTSGLIGGMGLAPGSNIGENGAMFEPVHGSAPDIAGQDRANPTAAILTGVLMLRYLDETDAADRLERAVAEVLREGRVATADLPRRPYGRLVGTREFTDAVIEALTDTHRAQPR
jgi:isocitrate dehydrogenase (NAD+)